MPVEILSTTTVTARGGLLRRVKHASTSTKTDMIFAIFLPSSYLIGAGKGSIPAICKSMMLSYYDCPFQVAFLSRTDYSITNCFHSLPKTG